MKKTLSLLLTAAAVLLTGCFADPEFDFEDVSFAEIMTEESRTAVSDEDMVQKLTLKVA